MGDNSVVPVSSGTRFPKNADFEILIRSPANLLKLNLRPCSLFKASRLFDNHLRVLHAISDKFETAVNASLDQIQNFFELDICSLSWKFHRKSVAEFSTFRIIFYFRPMCTCSLSIYSQLLSIATNIISTFSYCLQNLHADSSKFDVFVIKRLVDSLYFELFWKKPCEYEATVRLKTIQGFLIFLAIF